MTSQDPLQRLKRGVLRFQDQVYGKRVDAYVHAAAHPQRPHTLVIACADSRVDIETIFSADTGELFIARNIGNLVPMYGEVPDGASAVIEYAVTALKVRHAMVCGHSDCGAMKALLNPDSVRDLPFVREWLARGQAALGTAPTPLPEDAQRTLRELTERNVRLQLEHLKSQPAVARAMAQGELTVSGWVYEIGTGEVRVTEDGQIDFTPVTEYRAAGKTG